MKIKSDFTIQKVGQTYAAVAVGETSKTFHALIKLNETGAFLWNQLAQKDLTQEELMRALQGEYDVDDATAQRDVKIFVESLTEHGIIE